MSTIVRSRGYALLIFRELRENGYTPQQIVGLSSELIGIIATELATERSCASLTAARCDAPSPV